MSSTLNILKPSVNNMTVRIFVRAAGIDFEEVDVWGKTTSPEYVAKYPPHLTPMLEEDGLPAGAGRELRDHGLPLQQARARPLLPDRSRRARDGRQRDVLLDRHALSAAHARDLPALGFPQYPGEVGTSEADEA
jgi:glutathione S-transferase